MTELTAAPDNSTPATADLIPVRQSAVAGLKKMTLGALGTFLRSLGFEGGGPTPPLSSGYVWLNQGTSTATDGTGALIVKAQPSSVRSLTIAAPAAPFSFYMRLQQTCLSTAGDTSFLQLISGIVLRNSANNRIVILGSYDLRTSGDEQNVYSAVISRWSADGATFTADALQKRGVLPWRWIRCDVTATDATLYVSLDGKNWHSVGVELFSAHILAVTHIGMGFVAGANNTETICSVSYLSLTAP